MLTLLRTDEPAVLEARHNYNNSSSDLYLIGAQVIQSTLDLESRRHSSAPETPHSLDFSSLGSAA